MNAHDLLDDTMGGQPLHLANLPPAEIAKFVKDAQDALHFPLAAERTAMAGEPILVVTDVASQTRLSNLVPSEWKSSLTEMIMQAVERQDRT